MRKFYTEEMLNYLRENVEGASMKELTERFNERFGTNVTREAIKSCVNSRGWGNGLFHKSRIFPEEVRRFMAENCQGNRAREMVVLLKETFGKDWTEEQVARYYKKHGIKSGVASRYMPIGSLVFRTGEWYYEKVADGPNSNDNWRSKHVMVWEQSYGPVPKGHMVIFLNGNRRDYSLENLALCPKDVGLEVNSRGLRFTNPEATRAGMLIAELCLKVRRMEKKENRNGRDT